ncbi:MULTISPECIES: citramalate synthase [Brevibacillus]|jgi:2-isopropylmalate synthase|uniref:Citramalate synthase n=1 Tax=Brevibacillus borstelensis AK1 TaxID=1300222 RepID=M8D6W2_9BACL|nr:citramalate synthase [Brevibacillus borstelensis]EMT51994.1 alpha-isopropylmalate/homocitrate synthase family transferase [Brevibacillus borstelensis AK1]KKX56410.1 transferase [Brevibacillus borstelensis cifa_chp40]MBE5394167.1 citramalate synthase [Brevibacillus borstelensis]MCC0565540.1 citramalate synthase [Brevibacillus borstelensis]MCM3468881.1 citramalate synthase [Brevibacillus borstelensis]
MKPNVCLYDTTLRDGTQGEGVSLSVEDKVKIALRLDQFGIDFIEGGWPGSNPKDMAFFERIKEIPLQHATITAFGSTCRPNVPAAEDENLRALLQSGVSAAAIFGKSWDLHVTDALKTTLDENLRMVADSVGFLKSKGLTVLFLAEHFFDGYKANPVYALRVLEAAEGAGADWIVLCDTNGGSLPHEIYETVKTVKGSLQTRLGIHPHNDCELAVANALAAVQAGAEQVQGTTNGIGERCGNVNLVSVIPNLQLKMGYQCVEPEQLQQLTKLSRFVAEVANMAMPNNQPFVGNSAFAHKGGIHVSAVLKDPKTYEHIDPELIGNKRRVLVSELSGQSNLLAKTDELDIDVALDKQEAREIIQRIKEREFQGYQYEGAEASLSLMLLDAGGKLEQLFTLDSFKILMEKSADRSILSEATVKLHVNGQLVHTAAEGNGPVNALDNALRKALENHFPCLSEMHLTDYKVRVLDENGATAAKVRVLIESGRKGEKWSTVGVSTNVIEASWEALVDSIRYLLWKEGCELSEPQEQAEVRAGIVNH